MLELKNVCKTFNAGTPDEKRALWDVSLKIEDGDFVSIIGPLYRHPCIFITLLATGGSQAQ